MCVKPDGTLSPSAEIILKVCGKPVTIDEMAQATGLRSFRVKTSIRELTGAGLLQEDNGRFMITAAGTAKIQAESG
jgi:predicted transcriptional regulator